MKELRELKYDFQQGQFLKQLDPHLLTKAASAIGKAKAKFHKRRDEELRQQQQAWARQAALMQEASVINMRKAEAECQRLSASMGAHEAAADWSRFEGYGSGSNPRFFARTFSISATAARQVASIRTIPGR